MRPKALLLAALLTALALAGCTDAPDVPETTTDDTMTDEELPTFGPHSGLPRTLEETAARTLEAAPEWVLGEWWTIEITDRFTGGQHTVQRVVAGKEGDDYLVGMPLEGFDDEVLILHFPGFGLVTSDALGYEAHDGLFEPLRFPLTPNDSWDTLWENLPETVLVEDVDEATGQASLQAGGQQSVTYTYDATMGTIVTFDAPGYMTYEVVDHGFDYEGTVRVPHSHDLIFINGRIGPVPIGNSASPGISETITVDGDKYDRASFSLIAFELAPFVVGAMPPAGTGVSQITATAPDNTQYQLTKLPTDTGHSLSSFGHDKPGGDWELEVIAASGQQVFIEGIGYVVFDVELPSGCVVLTEFVHDHGGDCGAHVHDIE